MNKRERAEKLTEMRRLYEHEEWTLEQIGDHYGVTRQAVHNRFQRAGIKMRSCSDRKKPIRTLDRKKLTKLYEVNRLAIPIVAERLETSVFKVTQELKRYKIKIRPRGGQKKSWLRKLNVNECRIIQKPAHIKNLYRNLHGSAHSIGIKISVKRISENNFQVIRLS